MCGASVGKSLGFHSPGFESIKSRWYAFYLDTHSPLRMTDKWKSYGRSIKRTKEKQQSVWYISRSHAKGEMNTGAVNHSLIHSSSLWINITERASDCGLIFWRHSFSKKYRDNWVMLIQYMMAWWYSCCSFHDVTTLHHSLLINWGINIFELDIPW